MDCNINGSQMMLTQNKTFLYASTIELCSVINPMVFMIFVILWGMGLWCIWQNLGSRNLHVEWKVFMTLSNITCVHFLILCMNWTCGYMPKTSVRSASEKSMISGALIADMQLVRKKWKSNIIILRVLSTSNRAAGSTIWSRVLEAWILNVMCDVP